MIVLAGAGDHFSAGHDLGTPEELADRKERPVPADVAGRRDRSWQINVDSALRWRELPKPTIAAVQGYCIYAGCIIASAMDLIVAADDALFLPGMVQCLTVPWELGPRKAKELLFRSRLLAADEALSLGFVNEVVPRAELAERVTRLASEIAETEPFLARTAKRVVNQAQDAQGFRAAVQAAHAAYMLVELNGSLLDPANPTGPRLGPVAQALARDGDR